MTTNDAPMKDADRWQYPALAKPESDSFYCYHIQRRISAWFSVRLAGRMGANAATGLDLIFGVAAAVLVLLDHWLWGVVMIQLFGIFSCVDGEIARIQGRSSRIGDFLDTLTDRVVECCWWARSRSLCAIEWRIPQVRSPRASPSSEASSC